MDRRLLYVALAVMSFLPLQGHACRTHGYWKDRALAHEDRQKQRSLVRALTSDADAIYIADLVSHDREKNIASYTVQRVLKGSRPGVPLTFIVTDEVIVGCGAAASFTNAIPYRENPQIIYVKAQQLLRVSNMTGMRREIPVTEELSIMRETLAPNNSINR